MSERACGLWYNCTMNRLHTAPLRHVAVRAGLPPLPAVAQMPGISDALRLTIVYAQAPRRPPDRVATLKVEHTVTWMEVSYLTPGPPLHKRVRFLAEHYRALKRSLAQLGFDRLDDQVTTQLGGDLWLLERAAGGYHHDLVLMPGTASGVHLMLVDRIRQLWPEALREPVLV